MGKIGYARAIDGDLNDSIEMQVKALKDYGCEVVFYDTGSSSIENRTEFAKMLESLIPNDSLVCWKIDRLCRNVYDFAILINRLKPKNISIISIMDRIDTSSGECIDVSLFADFFSHIGKKNIKEMTKEGLRKAKERGTKLGRPKGYSAAALEKYSKIPKYLEDGMSIKDIANILETSRSVIYKYLQYMESNKKG